MGSHWPALSIKQPWAALVVSGLKSIEVRTWSTSQRGQVLIHAGRIPDDRPEGWRHLTTAELQAQALLTGGIVGIAELTGCRTYTTRDTFTADVALHYNASEWFAEPALYGFMFANARPLPFWRTPGKTFFFPVTGIPIDAPENGEALGQAAI